MFDANVLTFQEFIMHEPLPLATIQREVLEFLRGRKDVVVYGAQAVNAYVDQPRMTQDIDLLSPSAEALAKELRDYLRQKFHTAVRVRQISQGRGYRLFQIRKSGNRHLVDVRLVKKLPSAQRIMDIPVIAPSELIAYKVIAYHKRRGQPKSGTDWRDIAMLLLKFPDLKRKSGPVANRLKKAGADPSTLSVWQELVAQEIQPEEEEF